MMRKHILTTASALATLGSVLGLTGCVGRQVAVEKAARRQIAEVASQLGAQPGEVNLPTLTADSSQVDALRYAVLKHPRIRAAYYEWARAVERITVERSLPDPVFVFEADVSDMISSLMPGLMLELPGSRKRALAARAASAESEVKYHELEAQVQQVAYGFKNAYYQLYFLESKLRVNAESLELLKDLEAIARRQNEVGKATLQDVLRTQIEQDQMATEIANLGDARQALLAQYKAALGLQRHDPEPAIPSRFETTAMEVNPDQIWQTALTRNPTLRTMAAEVRVAEASLAMAKRSRYPDFSVGLEADIKASPVMARPSLGVTLPIWRDKIAAEIASAQSAKQAGEARLAAEQIMVAVELAEKTFMFREATRNQALIQHDLLPKAQQSLEVARAAYITGRTGFLDVIEASRSLLDFELQSIEAQTQRELSLAELALLVAGIPPENTPLKNPESN
jgi:cobalt-zinc-cadmium efflux system outer membrane protein